MQLDVNKKLVSGEYLSKWRGFSPFYLGSPYGEKYTLGGEEEFSHCWSVYYGHSEIVYWIKKELDALSPDESERLYNILIRNKTQARILDK